VSVRRSAQWAYVQNIEHVSLDRSRGGHQLVSDLFEIFDVPLSVVLDTKSELLFVAVLRGAVRWREREIGRGRRGRERLGYYI
jgi:hypothetical protein